MGPLALALGLAELVGPQIVKWVAGDEAGKVAEDVIGTATKITGKSAEEALKSLQESEELLRQFKLAVMSKEAELEQMYLQDRQSARARDLALHQAGFRNERADAMIKAAFVAVVIIIALLVLITLMGPPSTVDPPLLSSVVSILSTALGWLFKMLSDAYQFEFGSSRGSKDKDMLAALNSADLQDKLVNKSTS